MKQVALLLVGILTFKCLNAQSKDSTYFIRYGLTGIINRTNEASSYTIANDLNFNAKKKKVVLNSSSSWVYGQQQKRLTNNDFTTAVDVIRYFKENPAERKFYYWVHTAYETSFSLRVNSRLQSGAGGAWNIMKTDTLAINLSDGILYESTNLKVSETSNDVYSTFRNSFRLRFRYTLNKKITIESISLLQNSLSQKTDYIISSNTMLSFKLLDWVSLKSSLQYNKVNRNKRENLFITFGLTAEKYF